MLFAGHAEASGQSLMATIDGEAVAITFDDRLQPVTSTRALFHCDTQLREHPECAIKQLLACYIEYDLEPCQAIGLHPSADSVNVFGEWPAEEYHPPDPVRIEFRIKAISNPYAGTLFIDVDKSECWRYQDRWAWVLKGEAVRYVLTWEQGRGWRVAAWTPWLLDSNLAWLDYLGDKQDYPVADGVCSEG
jgi:hypothetical protein